jgi:hypothetical protein
MRFTLNAPNAGLDPGVQHRWMDTISCVMRAAPIYPTTASIGAPLGSINARGILAYR